MSSKTDTATFIGELDCGILEEKIGVSLSEVALSQILHGEKGRKGRLTIDLVFDRFGGDNAQVMISHKLTQTTLTKRGKKTEENTTETIMFVGKGGQLSIDAPKEEINGQFGLVHQIDGK